MKMGFPKPNFSFTRLGGVLGAHMAEYVIGQIISNERFFVDIVQDQKEKQWLVIPTQNTSECLRVALKAIIGIMI